jgi:hypothetical protein
MFRIMLPQGFTRNCEGKGYRAPAANLSKKTGNAAGRPGRGLVFVFELA